MPFVRWQVGLFTKEFASSSISLSHSCKARMHPKSRKAFLRTLVSFGLILDPRVVFEHLCREAILDQVLGGPSRQHCTCCESQPLDARELQSAHGAQ